MKRALAERAKQQGDGQQRLNISSSGKVDQMHSSSVRTSNTSVGESATLVAVAMDAPSNPPSSPPQKIPRGEKGQFVRRSPMPQSQSSPHSTSAQLKTKNNTTRTPPPQYQSNNTSSSSSKTLKRPRNDNSQFSPPESTRDQEVTPSDNDDGDFYLRHQNQALASELYAYKRKISLLERERSHRRCSYSEIGESLKMMGSSWAGVEEGILGCIGALGGAFELPRAESSRQPLSIVEPRYASTGSGSDIETIGKVFSSMNELAQSHPLVAPFTSLEGENSGDVANGGQMNGDDSEHHLILNSLAGAAAAFSDRCKNFQSMILQIVDMLIRNSTLPPPASNIINEKLREEVFHSVEIHKEISSLRTTCTDLKSKIVELERARDESNESERKVRRGLHRIATGRMNISEVLQALEKGDSALNDIAEFKKNLASSSDVSTPNHTLEESKDNEGKAVSDSVGNTTSVLLVDGINYEVDDILHLKKQLNEYKEVSKQREKRILQLTKDQEVSDKKINSLILSTENKRKVTNEHIETSLLHADLKLKLMAAEKKNHNLVDELESVKKRWAISKGDLNFAKKIIADLGEKHRKRWSELGISEQYADPKGIKTTNSSANYSVKGEENIAITNNHIELTKKIVTLENKLKHALENVRQSETIRQSLNEANTMNEALQSKLEELKSKNATLVANKAAARASLVEASSSTSLSTPHKSSKDHNSSNHSLSLASSSSSSSSLKDKYHRIRKELSAAINSKDQAKVKQERAEKERDMLMRKNMRLIKQSTEKDDMNAKCLSTILQLNQTSEHFELEREILQKKLKSVEQLALAARLAANAKSRVEEEALREKEAAMDEIRSVKERLVVIENDKEKIQSNLEQVKEQHLITENDLKSMKSRCDELVAKSSALHLQTEKNSELLAVARKECAEAEKRAATIEAKVVSSSKINNKNDGMFTPKQLATQVEHLKGRLVCPVCNTKDKEVILSRCRHMFCSQCIDINIKNRSRKCPVCAQRFDMKDVGRVWL